MLDPIETFFAGYPPPVQAISRTLRAMVQSAMPQANERLFARHNHIGYLFSESIRDSICYICPMKDYARLGFMYGTHLEDPHKGRRYREKRQSMSEILAILDHRNGALDELSGELLAEMREVALRQENP